jgi:sensor histidine kinase YesM
MKFLKAIGLWILLTFFFSLANHSYEPSEVLIQGINAALFTIGFYFSYRFLVLPFLYTRRTVRFIACYLLVIVTLSAISMVTVYRVYVYQDKKFFVENYWSDPVFFTSNFILVLLVTSTLVSIRVTRDKMRTQAQLENMEKEKINAELGFLKAQMNPHFLFNSLNNILFQIDKSNSVARETLLKFSAMLRYQLYDCATEQVEIEQEVSYIRNYFEIQSLRRSDKYCCQLSVSETVRNFKIAPLLLIPFIENAFKHISHHASGGNTILTRMECLDGKFIFSVANTCDHSKNISIHENKGIGLTNVKRRLDLIYQNRHTLEVKETESDFTVMLKLEID